MSTGSSTDIANRVLDALGMNVTIGDLEDGSREAAVLLRSYQPCLEQLLRAAHWNFARKQAPLLLLGDATGQTVGVGTTVQQPWTYCYAYPTDCVRARYLPLLAAVTAPVTGATGVIPGTVATPVGVGAYFRSRAKFVVSTDYNYPPPVGSDPVGTSGIAVDARTVVNTNVQNAQLVYTALQGWPTLWDPLFTSAFIAFLASETVLALVPDRKLSLGMRQQQITIAQSKITAARVADGNEGVYSVAREASWISSRYRSLGIGPFGQGGDAYDMVEGPGVYGYGWDTVSFSDGGAF